MAHYNAYPDPPRDPRHNDAHTTQRARAESQSGYHQDVMRQAVNSAVTDVNEVKSQAHDPDLVAAITKSVLDNLKLSGIATVPVAAHVPPTGSTTIPPRNVYTPPEPERFEPPSVDVGRSSFDSKAASEGRQEFDGAGGPPSRQPSLPPKSREPSRPSPMDRIPTDDRTVIEKVWQPLFDDHCQPTPRLGQFLRGLAMHLIESYEPRGSLVVTPRKMHQFYKETKLPSESYPWEEIFGGRLKHSDLSHIYRDLECEHFFVQPTGPGEKPTVPALTPQGFQRWMTLQIKAHPTLEFERFSKALVNMPINNADDVKERFPKELSRRLFPKMTNAQVKMMIGDSIYADGDLTQMAEVEKDLLDKPATTLPIPQDPREQERNYSSATSSELAEEGLSKQIERERKPYHAKPGQGRVFDQDERGARAETVPRHMPSKRADDDFPVQSRYRSGSVTATQQPQRRRHSPSAPHINPYSRSDTGVASHAYSSNMPTDDDDTLRRYVSDEHRRYRADEISRDYPPPGPPRASHDDDRRRSRAYPEYPPMSGAPRYT